MMRMVEEINRRVDTLPGHEEHAHQTSPAVTCATCHRGVSRPMPLFSLMIDAVTAGGADMTLKRHRVRSR